MWWKLNSSNSKSKWKQITWRHGKLSYFFCFYNSLQVMITTKRGDDDDTCENWATRLEFCAAIVECFTLENWRGKFSENFTEEKTVIKNRIESNSWRSPMELNRRRRRWATGEIIRYESHAAQRGTNDKSKKENRENSTFCCNWYWELKAFSFSVRWNVCLERRQFFSAFYFALTWNCYCRGRCSLFTCRDRKDDKKNHFKSISSIS